MIAKPLLAAECYYEVIKVFLVDIIIMLLAMWLLEYYVWLLLL